MNISKNMKIFRKAIGWTQVTLATKSGIPQATISRIEAGHIKDPSISIIVKLAKAFEINIEDLLVEGLNG